MAEDNWRNRARTSCPDLWRQISADDDNDDSDPVFSVVPPGSLGPKGQFGRGKEPFAPVVDWFRDRIEIVGHPRPERQTNEDFNAASDAARQEAMRQVAFMAERYRAELDHRRDFFTRKARSSPDLSSFAEQAAAEEEIPAPIAPPSEGAKVSAPVPPSCGDGLARCWEATSKLLQTLRGSQPLTDGRSAEDSSLENSLIIFDWDDTLLPTTYILQTVLPSLPAEDREGAVPRSSPFYEELEGHAHVAGFVLRVARRVARVAIVTNSLSPWVIAGAARYMPGLDIEALLLELDIPVYYARRHSEAIAQTLEYHEETLEVELDHSRGERIGLDIVPANNDGSLRIARIDENGLVGRWNRMNPCKQVHPGDWIVEVNGTRQDLAIECRKPQMLKVGIRRDVPNKDPYVEAKRIDMESCVGRFCATQGRRPNVISIGDSAAEQVAIKEVLPRTGRPATDPLCKTVSLLMRPTVQQLSNELKILAVWLSYMVKYEKDFDLAMDNLDSLERKLFEP